MSAIGYRPYKEADLPFILESWITSFFDAHAAGIINSEDWHGIMYGQLTKIIKRPCSSVHVAYCPSEQSNLADLYGWIAYERRPGTPPIVHYVYVKWNYRKNGIAKNLFREVGININENWIYTCKTAILQKLNLGHGKWFPMYARMPQSPPKFRPRLASKSNC